VNLSASRAWPQTSAVLGRNTCESGGRSCQLRTWKEPGLFCSALAHARPDPERSGPATAIVVKNTAYLGALSSRGIRTARNRCDVLIHEALIPALIATRPATFQRFAAKYHTTTAQVAALARKAKPKLRIIYHAMTPDEMFADMSKRYSGQFVVGRDLAIY
jgi:ribonuclease BN (tRNA processing enzyme)